MRSIAYTSGVTIGFQNGETLTVTEKTNLTAKACAFLIAGSLEREVSVYATTYDITATGM